MPSPFPGMDPYIEQPTFWSSLNFRLIGAIAAAIEPQLSRNYYVEIETRTYQTDGSDELLIGLPDAAVIARQSTQDEPNSESPSPVATRIKPATVVLPMPVPIKERYLEVREVGSDAVITVVEVLSPSNKRPGEGRTIYQNKRQQVLGSATHLIEIDLLRGGEPMPILGQAVASAYRVLVSRSDQRPTADLYAPAERLKSKEFSTTVTELKAINPPAAAGLRLKPAVGSRTPAARGMPTRL
jgi:hypothetical protein